jgi:ERF superfamily
MSNIEKTPVEIQSAIMRIVERTDIDPDRLEKFLDLQFKAEARQAATAFQQALAGFQGDCPIIVRTRKINFTSKSGNATKYNYSPLDEIIHVIKPILTKWGFSYTFDIKKTDDSQVHELLTKIYHSMGHSETFSYFFNNLHDDQRMNLSQRAKSAITYAKRAALENALGIVTAEDDDDARRAIDNPASDVQIGEIRKLIKSTKSKEEDLLKFMKIESLDELTEFEAKKALHALKQKRSKKLGDDKK